MAHQIIHIALNEVEYNQLNKIASHNHLKPTTFASSVLKKEIDRLIKAFDSIHYAPQKNSV